MEFEVGDVISTGPRKFSYLYELLDDEGHRFYVGVTENPEKRFLSYRSWKSLRVQSQALSSKVRSVQVLRMRILGKFEDRKDALAEESRIVKSEPGLLNYTGYLRKGQSFEPHLAKLFLTSG